MFLTLCVREKLGSGKHAEEYPLGYEGYRVDSQVFTEADVIQALYCSGKQKSLHVHCSFLSFVLGDGIKTLVTISPHDQIAPVLFPSAQLRRLTIYGVFMLPMKVEHEGEETRLHNTGRDGEFGAGGRNRELQGGEQRAGRENKCEISSQT